MTQITKDFQYYKFCSYGFLRNLRFFEAFLILFLIQKGFSYTSVGILYAIREISANILEIPSGIAADVLGRKKTLITSFFAYIISFLTLYSFSGFPLFVLAFFLYGVGKAFRSGTHKGMIVDYLKVNGMKDQMINYYGHTRSWSQKGLAVSSLIAGLIVFSSGNYSGIFLFSTIPYVINLLLILSYPSYLDKGLKKESRKKRQQLSLVLRESFETLKNRKILNLLNISALHTAYLKAMKDYIQPMLLSLVLLIPFLSSYNDDQRSAIFIGIVYFITFLLTSQASALAGKLAKTKKDMVPEITLISGLSAGLLSGIFYLFNNPLGAVLCFIPIYLIENLRKPVLTGYVSDQVDSSILTSVLSVQSQIKTIFTALIALSFGVIADKLSISWSLIIISSTLILLTSIINLISKNKG